MTPIEVLQKLQSGRFDQRTLRHAVRLRSLVTLVNEKSETLDTYDKVLKAKQLGLSFTRRGNEVLAGRA
jgi:hypothetical protein